MSSPSSVGLPEALERAATALPADAGDIRPANGDPAQLRRMLGHEAARRVLQWLLENEPAEGGQLANAWADDPDLDPAPLLQVELGALPKAAKKAVRRAQHRLRSRGVAVAEEGMTTVVATLGRVEDELSMAALTPVDPRGARVAYLVEENPAGGARIFEVMFDDERGIVGFEVYTAARGKVRRFLRELTRRASLPAVEAPPDAVRSLVARVAGYQPPNRPAPRGFTEWRSRVTAAPESSATPGVLARQGLGEIDPGGVNRAAELIRRRELGPWPPENPALQTAAEKIVEIEKSELIVSASARREQADRVIDAAIGDLFVEPFTSRCAERFEEMAYVYWKWDREDDARACLAAADAFASGAAAERPVERAMLEVLLAPVLCRLEEVKDDGTEDSLIVKP
jgi:hypothetical protein